MAAARDAARARAGSCRHRRHADLVERRDQGARAARPRSRPPAAPRGRWPCRRTRRSTATRACRWRAPAWSTIGSKARSRSRRCGRSSSGSRSTRSCRPARSADRRGARPGTRPLRHRPRRGARRLDRGPGDAEHAAGTAARGSRRSATPRRTTRPRMAIDGRRRVAVSARTRHEPRRRGRQHRAVRAAGRPARPRALHRDDPGARHLVAGPGRTGRCGRARRRVPRDRAGSRAGRRRRADAGDPAGRPHAGRASTCRGLPSPCACFAAGSTTRTRSCCTRPRAPRPCGCRCRPRSTGRRSLVIARPDDRAPRDHAVPLVGTRDGGTGYAGPVRAGHA